jgi:ABC-2 type transport system ATP-binding protein
MLEVRNVSKRFGATVALADVSLAVREGEVVGFLGPNGSGKTTTMRSIMGLISVDAGDVLWKGQPITADIRHRFGYMPAERGMYPKMRVREQLVYFARLAGRTAPDATAAADHWLARLGLTDRAGDEVQALSSGNQQRVQLAIALAHDPELLILDEPFSGLDPIAVETMKQLLLEQVARGVAVLFSSHQLDLVTDICRDVVIVDQGRIVLEGDVHELRGRSPFRDVVVRYESRDEPELLRVPASTTIDEVLAQLADRRSVDESRIVDLSFGPPALSEVFLRAVGRTEAEIAQDVDAPDVDPPDLDPDVEMAGGAS